MRIILACLVMVLCFVGTVSVGVAEVVVGLNSPRGEAKAMRQWGPLADYLEEVLGEKVRLRPNKVEKLLKLTEKGEVDFVFANPVQTIIMQEELGVTPLVTRNNKNGPMFAGLIIALKKSGIRTAADLKGKSVISLSPSAAAAYVFQSYHLLQKGIDPHKDFASFTEGKKLDSLVYHVRNGLAAAAFIKTGVLENMAKEGKIDIDQFVVVDQRKDANFPQLHTTQLYPGWFFSATPKAEDKMVVKVKEALLRLTSDHPACKTAKINGFVDDLPLDELKIALKALKVRPYNK